MSEASAPASPQTGDKPGTPEEWKPEPRQWTWKDVFTAPMLAFKPKCMLVTALTVIALGFWFYYQPDSRSLFGRTTATPASVSQSFDFLWVTVALVIFSLSATLVAVFMKADLLDDEFLSFGEALGQFKKRIVPAILVPIFLMGLLAGFTLLLGGAELVGSIPYAGPAIYALLYPLGFLLGLFLMLLSIAVVLSLFVFPSIIAIRKHGWFDNVVDTFEAVGTKPHILVISGILTVIMIGVAAKIGFGAMKHMRDMTELMPGKGLQHTEMGAADLIQKSYSHALGALANMDRTNTMGTIAELALSAPTSDRDSAYNPETMRFESSINSFHKVTGAVTGVWQVIITGLLLGYCLNLFIGGGMLTYLVVREDDYWDDEDLEDLDQLAKELEDEAKAEASKPGAPAAAAPIVPAAPAAAPTEPPPAPAQT